MIELIKKWYPEDDPITLDQVKSLVDMLGDDLTETALEGFLIVAPRFVDEYGDHRTSQLIDVFRTDTVQGRRVLLASLEHVQNWVGGLHALEKRYPVTIIPPRPAFPLFKIVGLQDINERVYRALDSTRHVRNLDLTFKEYIAKNGRLPMVPRQRHPVRRSKPFFHWCSYERWITPEETQRQLQVLPEWSDCRIRAWLPTRNLNRSAYVAFNGDRLDPTDSKLKFYKYFYEPLALDHPQLLGGAVQVGVEGAPLVDILEEWNDSKGGWEEVWRRK